MTTAADFSAPAPDAANDAAAEPWPDPDPFDSTELPDFPVEALSPWLRDWALAAASFAQVPVDMPSAIALASASLAVARRFDVRVRPGWEEPCNLWIVVAAPPGERKSPIFAHATAPAYAFAGSEAERLGHGIAERDRDRRVLLGQIDAAEAAAVKGKPYGGGDAVQAARELQSKLDDLPELRSPTLLTDDVTPEALAVVLAQNGERIGLFSAEGGPFEMMSGRYAQSGSNFEIYLKAHAGDCHAVNRIKREAIFLKRPLLTMALTVQPHVIEGLAAKEGFRGKGLLARFIYSMPRTALGRRVVDTPAVPGPIAETYGRAMRRMFEVDVKEGWRTLELSREADHARASYQSALEPRLGPDGDLSTIADWAGKLVGTIARIAGVLHVADHATATDFRSMCEVPGPTFERAVAIGNYALAHALAAFGAMGADEQTELAKRVWGWVRRKRLQAFSKRDAVRAVHAQAEEITPALAVLVERRLVRARTAKTPTGGRPASDSYDCNPRANT